MITSDQIRAARALLNWSRAELASKSGIGLSALMRLESSEGVPSGHTKTLNTVQKTFEDAKVEFIGTPENGAGVRWKNNPNL